MLLEDFEIFKYGDNHHVPYVNNGTEYMVNRHPYLDIVLTDHCNQDCAFCIADLVHEKKILDLEVLKHKVTFAIKNLGVREVLVLGGEPTLYKNLVVALRWLGTLGLDKVVMTTNGLRLAEDPVFREEVLSSGLTHVNVSFMSVAPRNQSAVTGNKHPLNTSGMERIYETAHLNGVKVRINNNIYRENNDTVMSAVHFYKCVADFCDSLKFSPIFEVDSFSVVDFKTTWAKENSLSHEYLERLFYGIERYFITMNDLSIIENPLQFGFVKNTMIPLKTPIIMNWNFGKYTGMMDKVVRLKQINNLKLLPVGELSLSWNREMEEYFINTEKEI